MIRKFFNLTLIVTLTITAALAQQPSSTTPSVDGIRQTITYLSSDVLEGRRTGTPGANDAARYIAGEFKRYGLLSGKPAIRAARGRGEPVERYLQPFPYVAGVELGKNNSMQFIRHGGSHGDISTELRVGEDWMPLGFSTNDRIVNGGVAFAGYGISSSELKYDDYAVSSAKGRVAVAFSGTPDGDNPHGQFARAGEIRFKAAAARAAGVRALVIIANEEKLKEDRLFRLSYDNAGEAGIPVLVVSRDAAARILGAPLSVYAKIADARTGASGDNQGSTSAREGLSQNITSTVITRLPMGGLDLSLTTNVVRREVPANNVIGVLPGSDPTLKDEAIAIGAHYDHLGRGGEGSLAPREGEIHHGADDNASGTAALIELARIFSAQNPKPRRTIIFIAFSGEEEGLIGSSYYVNHPIVPLAKTVAMINMDMIGRLKDNKLIVGGVGTSPELRAWIQNVNSSRGMMRQAVSGFNRNLVNEAVSSPTGFELTLNEDGYGPSDHSSFYAKQIPVLFFWTGTHEDYHKPSDTADKINYVGEARIVGLIANVVRNIDRNDQRPNYTVAKSEAQGRSSGFRVYLGTIPNYADSNDGLKLDGVRDDSPASKAGLKAGDKIVKMAGRDVKNVYDYTYALGEMKAGQEYEVELMRGNERLTLKITPAVGRK